MSIQVTKLVRKLRNKMRFLFWLHEYGHIFMCKIFGIRYIIMYDEERSNLPIGICIFGIDYYDWRGYLIGAFPIILLFPVYVFDLKQCIKEECTPHKAVL